MNIFTINQINFLYSFSFSLVSVSALNENIKEKRLVLSHSSGKKSHIKHFK